MSQRDMTHMGGVQKAFLTTHWSMIDAVKKSGSRDSALIGLLMQRYWKPVYCYLRGKGHQNESPRI